jgi:hypothetical protein
MWRLLSRLWHSPTFTTWASFATRTLNLVLVLPLVLKHFTSAELALWQVLVTLISLQLLVEAGFGTTFSRFMAYAMGGAKDLSSGPSASEKNGELVPNWVLLRQICGTMRVVYRRFSWVLGALFLLGGTLALMRRVEALPVKAAEVAGYLGPISTQRDAWIAWGMVFFTTVVNFRSNAYSALLQGTNHIALVRRWEAFFGLGSIITSLTALGLKGGLLALVIANQSWTLLSAWRNVRLCRGILDGRLNPMPKPEYFPEVFSAAWPPVWRSAVGVLMSHGLVHLSGLLFAQSRDSQAVASYLLAVRLIHTLATISTAPFYTKLPVLSRLWTEGKREEKLRLAERGMRLSHLAFVVPWVMAGLCGPTAMRWIGAKTPFPAVEIWCLLGLAMMAERYGAMHLQLYSVTNRIVWHIANGVTGSIFVLLALVLYPMIGVTALPLGMVCANFGFYAWYTSRLSHREFSLGWPGFDWRTVGWPLVVTILYLGIEVGLAVLKQR